MVLVKYGVILEFFFFFFFTMISNNLNALIRSVRGVARCGFRPFLTPHFVVRFS